MVQKDIHVPPEVQHFITERNVIWSELDTARSHAGQLDQYAQKIGGMTGQAIQISTPFAKSSNPSDEITAVIGEINKQMKQIDDFEREVRSTQEQVANIRQRARTMTTVLIVAIIIVIGIVGLVIINAVH